MIGRRPPALVIVDQGKVTIPDLHPGAFENLDAALTWLDTLGEPAAPDVALERARQQNLMPMGIKNMPVAMRVAPEQARQPCGFKYKPRFIFARNDIHPRCSRTAVRPPHARAG